MKTPAKQEKASRVAHLGTDRLRRKQEDSDIRRRSGGRGGRLDALWEVEARLGNELGAGKRVTEVLKDADVVA